MNHCPDRELLERLLNDRLADNELEELDRHVKGCASCQRNLEELTDDPIWKLGLRHERSLLAAAESGRAIDPLARTAAVTDGADLLEPQRVPTVPGYEISGELGRGGMGVVYKARHVLLNRPCALKMILAGLHASPEHTARFVTEAEAIARLAHPGIVQIRHIGEADGLPFLELEYVAGGGLDRQLDGTPWSPVLAAQLAEQVASGISEAHRQGIVHRDLKPSNVLMAADGTPKVADFGLAKMLDGQSALTRSESVMGSPSYMAPEQAHGRAKEAGPAVDVYSIGAVLYELLAGRPPFRGATALETIEQVKTTEPVHPSRLVPGVPGDIETICLKCLQKEPRMRYETALALRDDLRRFVEGSPILARPTTTTEQLWRWCRRNPGLAVASSTATSLLVFLAIGASIAAWIYRQQADRIGRQRNEINRQLTENQQAWRSEAFQRELAEAKSRESRELAGTLDRKLYINRVNLAYRECLANNITAADRLLADCPPVWRGWEWAYCRRLCHDESLTLSQGYPGIPLFTAAAVALGADGRQIAAISDQGRVRFWDAETGREDGALSADGGPFVSVACSPDGRKIAVGGRGTITIWEAGTRRVTRTIRAHEGLVNPLAFSPDGRRIASGMSTAIKSPEKPELKIWDVETGRELGAFRDIRWGRVNFAFSPDGRQIAYVLNWLDTIRLLDGTTGQENEAFTDPAADGALAAAFSPDGRKIAAAYRSGMILLWDRGTGVVIRMCRGHTGPVLSVTFDPDGRVIASAGADGSVRLWETRTGRELATFRGHTSPVYWVQFAPDGTRLVSAAYDETIKFWELLGGEAATIADGYRGWAFRAQFSPDSRQLVSAGFGVVRVHDAETGQTLGTIGPFPGGGVWGMALSPDGRRVAIGSEFRNEFDTWDAANGRKIVVFRGHAGPIRGVAWSPDGQRIASASEDKTIKIWDAASGRETRSLRGHAAVVCGVAFNPGGNRIASISWDGTVKLWEVATGAEVSTFRVMVQSPSEPFGNIVSFRPDGRWLAAAGADGRVVIWDVETSREVHSLGGHSGPVMGVAFSPDGRRIASADYRGIKLWDVHTGEHVFTIQGPHSPGILGLAFSPDGSRIASAGTDMTVRIWNAMSPTAEILLRRRALVLVWMLFQRFSLKDNVIAHLRADKTYGELIRATALEMAAGWKEDSSNLNNASWAIVQSHERSRADYDRALRWSEAACRLEPDDANLLKTLGIAQYRVEQYETALSTLTRSNQLNGNRRPTDLAFLAMALHRLGRTEASRASLNHLREFMRTSKSAASAENRAFLREAERLILGPSDALPLDVFAP